ncbi:uncharacterized FCP1 homology domain-containing protein C1271.03c-like [Andrographis paniculata]|uniref:uncharacterized FCP1 homology domain-containing protein C1271.03c-like n=1 Tax=Andrographis paniculata TaxID=175694 RepID=UPI0021E7FDCF|nr:uncharacterized FCP1 homology domain-containing protein C1271.03c-like [Andrographis paniculata]
MAESSKDANRKLSIADEEEEEEAAIDEDLSPSLDKLSIGRKKKLLVLSLGGLLVHRVHKKEKRTVRGLRADVTYGAFLVFKRPFCTDFLKFCFERFDVALWSSAREHNIECFLSSVADGEENKFVFVWSQSECSDSGFYSLHKDEKPLFVKELKRIWYNKTFKARYSAANTLLIDNEPHTALLNPPDTAIFPHAYKTHNPDDTFLCK